MVRLGSGGFAIDTIWSWLLVLGAFTAFTAFIVAIAIAILFLYNVLATRTGRGLCLGGAALSMPSGQPELSVSAHSNDDEATSAALYDQARELDIEGRSHMSKDELKTALRRARRRTRALHQCCPPPLLTPMSHTQQLRHRSVRREAPLRMCSSIVRLLRSIFEGRYDRYQ